MIAFPLKMMLVFLASMTRLKPAKQYWFDFIHSAYVPRKQNKEEEVANAYLYFLFLFNLYIF